MTPSFDMKNCMRSRLLVVRSNKPANYGSSLYVATSARTSEKKSCSRTITLRETVIGKERLEEENLLVMEVQAGNAKIAVPAIAGPPLHEQTLKTDFPQSSNARRRCTKLSPR